MKWAWEEIDSQEENFELKLESVVLVLQDPQQKILILGQLSGETKGGTKFDLSEILHFLKKFKERGSKREDLKATLIFPSDWKTPRTELEDFFKGYQIEFKMVEYPSKKISHLRISPKTAELFLLKTDNAQGLLAATVRLRVLIVEDSLPVQKILEKVLKAMPNVEIVGVEGNVRKAVQRFHALQPDLVTLDMTLEGGSGLDFLEETNFKEYAKKSGARCVLVTDCSINEHGVVAQALENGGSSYLQKPELNTVDHFSNELAMLLSPDVNRRRGVLRKSRYSGDNIQLDSFKLIAIGSSTGGTEVVVKLLKNLPPACPPIVIVQHMPKEFTGPFALRLAKESGRRVTEVVESVPLKKNEAYLANGSSHIVIEHKRDQLVARPKQGPPVNRFRPSISVFFDSIARAKVSARTVALMLTGMGSDGALEMLSLKREGALTIGQSKETCVVYGMPRAAEQLGAVCFEASPEEMVAFLSKKAS